MRRWTRTVGRARARRCSANGAGRQRRSTTRPSKKPEEWGPLFRLAHATFESHKKAVEKARDDAQAAGMDVNSHGHCTMNLDKVEAKKGKKVADQYRGDKQAQTVVEEKWDGAIKKAVREAQEADAAMKKRFMADPKEPEKGLPGGFNGAIGEEAVKRTAKRVANTYNSLKNGEVPPPRELQEASILARGLDEDPEFSRTLINSVGGPEGLVKVHNRLDDLAYVSDPEHKKSYLSLDRGLAANLASATKNPESSFYKDFKDKMEKVGLKKYDLKLVTKNPDDAPGPGPVRGYQSLVSLMQRGDDNYGKQFLTDDTADAIRKAEDEGQSGDPDVWDLKGNFDGKKYAHFANDPYDGILEVMSRQPEVSTEYLDPGKVMDKGDISLLSTERPGLEKRRNGSGGARRSRPRRGDQPLSAGSCPRSGSRCHRRAAAGCQGTGSTSPLAYGSRGQSDERSDSLAGS